MKFTMELSFLVTAWLVSTFQGLAESTDTMTMPEKMLSSLSTLLTPNRQKRELVERPSLVDDTGVHRLVSIKPVAHLCQPSIRTLFLDVSNNTYAVCVTASTTDTPAEVVVGYYKNHAWSPIQRWIVNNAVDAAAFYFRDHIYVLIADSDKNFGLELMKINLKTNVLVLDHEISSHFPTSISVWRMKSNGRLNLAVANSNGFKDAEDMSSEVFIYEWKGTYFDQNASFIAYDVKDIEPFHIYGVAYIAVANFRRGKSRSQVDSEIFRFDQDKGKWMSHQKIATYGAMDWEFFSLGTDLGQEFFLAVANKGNGESLMKTMIYKFVEDKFVPFQCLPVPKAVSVASFSKAGVFVLAVASEVDAVHFYQYDGWRFVQSGVQFTRGSLAEGVVHLTFYNVKLNLKDVLILSVSNPRHPYYKSVHEISFTHENLLSEWNSKSRDWCLDTLSKLDSTDLSKMLDFSNVVYTNLSSIHIDGDIIFEKGFTADTVATSEFQDVSTEEIFDNKLLEKLESLQRRLEVIKQKTAAFAAVFEKAMRIDGNQEIKSQMEFQDAFFSCGDGACHFKNIATDVLNGEKVFDWANRVVFTDKKQVISGTLMSDGINASSVKVSGFVDGVKTKNLVTKSGDHIITGRKMFKNSVAAQDIEVLGKVDGLKLSPDTILLSTGHQIIRGNKSFESLNSDWLKADFINRRNLSEFLNELLLTDKSYNITGEKTFNHATFSDLNMLPGSSINEIDLMELWDNSLWIDGNQEMKADIQFSGITFERNLHVTEGINGIKIPGSKIIDVTEPARFEVPQTFQNSSYIRNLFVEKSLNGMSVMHATDGSKYLDIMLKTGPQIITGSKTFRTIHLDAASEAKGRVDGVDLSELGEMVLRKNASVITNGTWNFKTMWINGSLTVHGLTSNVDLNEVYGRALKLNESITSEIVFKSHIFVRDIQSSDINGIDIKNDLVLVNVPQQITGKISFDRVILEENSLILGLVNDIDFGFFSEVLLVIGNQNIKSKTFNRNVIVRNLTVEGAINNFPISDIMTIDGGEIFGSRTLNGVTFSTIEAKNIEIDSGIVNNIDLNEMINDTLTYYDYQEVSGQKNVIGTIRLVNDTNLQNANLNGIDLNALWADAVLTDTFQVITGVVKFEGDIVVDSFTFNGTVDGVSDGEMRNEWMLKRQPQVVRSNTVFQNGFSAKELNSRAVNNLDLKYLNSNIVRVNEESQILGPVIFENSVSSTGIQLTGKIQGVDLSETAVLKNNPVVSGEKTFLQDVVIKKDLTVDGLVNDIDKDFCDRTSFLYKDIVVPRLVIKGDVSIREGTINGHLAGVDLSLLGDVAVRNESMKFSGMKTFKNVTFLGPVVVTGKFGKIPISEVAASYMSLSKDQEISAVMEFDEATFKGTLSASNFNTVDKKLNGIDLPVLNNRILKKSMTRNVTATYSVDELVFESDVIVEGKVNGLELPSGVMRHNRTNYIQSPKIFQQPVHVLGDLNQENGKTIQGVDLSEWYRRAVFKEGAFPINGLKTFNELFLNDVKVDGLMDSLEISEKSLLMTYGDQVINGRKIVIGNVGIGHSLMVNGLINTVNVSDLAKTVVQRSRSLTISGLKYFTKPLTALSLKARTVSGIDIKELEVKLNSTLDTGGLENRLKEIENVLFHTQEAFTNQATVLQYYELLNKFSTPVYDWQYVSGPDCGEVLLMLTGDCASSSSCSGVKVFGFDKVSNSFIPARQELTSYATSVRSLALNSTFLFIATTEQESACSGNQSLPTEQKQALDIYSWAADSFERQQSLQMNKVVDMDVFRSGNKACLVILEVETKVLCSMNYLNWSLAETLHTRGGMKVSILQSRQMIMAIAAEESSNNRLHWKERRSVDIYVWNSEREAFLAPKQVIESTFTQSVALIKHNNEEAEEVFLVMAEGSIPNIRNKPKILIYRYESGLQTFGKYQEIDDYGDLEWLLLKTGELLIFVVDTLQRRISVYQYKGVSGFVKTDELKGLGASRVHPFVRKDPEDWGNHYLALAGSHVDMTRPGQDEHYAKILKSKVKGKSLLY